MVWQNWPKYLDGCPVWTAATVLKKANIKIFVRQIANDKTSIVSTENVQKVHSRQKLWWFEKISKMPCQLPSLNSCHGPRFKNFCANQIGNDQTIVLSQENPQKVHSRPKLWAFEKKFPRNCTVNESCHLWTAATSPIFDEIQKFLRPSGRELPGNYFGLWNFWKRLFLAWVTDDQSLVTNRGTFCPVFTPIHHCFWISVIWLPVCNVFRNFL